MIKKIIFSTVFIVVVVFVGILLIKYLTSPISLDDKKIDFLITKGSSVSLISNNLYKQGLIKNPIAFKFLVQLTSTQNRIQSGEFRLSTKMSLIEILETLQKGPAEIWVTIPEGLRREEIALKFANSLGKDEEFVKEFLSLTLNKEGYLFPDTYLFPKTATTSLILNKIQSTFDKRVLKVSNEELIVASLLERETFSEDEKPIVSGIIYKRLKAGWPLQIDATLQYAKDSIKCKTITPSCKYWEPIYSQDKEINSAFNTYKFVGLPPAPISNPGLSAINASVNPETSEYWYYIHDNNGKIHFAKTLEEHNANIRKYLD